MQIEQHAAAQTIGHTFVSNAKCHEGGRARNDEERGGEREREGGATKTTESATDDGETWAHQEGRNLGGSHGRMDGRWTRARTRKDAKQGETERGGRFAKVSGIYRLKTGEEEEEEEEEEQTQQTRHRRAVRSGAGRDFSAINKRARGRGAAATAVNYGCWWVGAGDSKFSKSLLDEATVRAGPGRERAESARRRRRSVSLKIVFAPLAALRSRRRVGPRATVKTVSVGPGPATLSPLSSLVPLHPLGRARPPARSPSLFPLFCLPFAVIFCRCPLGDLQMIHSYYLWACWTHDGRSWKPRSAIT